MSNRSSYRKGSTHKTPASRVPASFVTQVVCELKFPTILEFGTSRPPNSFASAMRKMYPNLEAGKQVAINLGQGTSESSQAHIFRAARGGWYATLKQSSVSIEGNAYEGFADLRSRVQQLVAAASPIIDSDMWTRIGLRYVNTVQGDPLDGWVNPTLVNPLQSDLLTPINAFGGAIQIGDEEEGALVRHQLVMTSKPADEDPDIAYVLDIDVFRTVVDVSDTFDILDELHERSSQLFNWTLGDKGKAYLKAEA